MLDAISIPTATRVVVVILIMVNPEIAALAIAFKLFCQRLMSGIA
jgi:hypothetical protein